MYLLDTNVLSELRVGKPQPDAEVLRWAASVPVAMQFISPISLMEIDIGILRLERKKPPEGQALRLWLEQLRRLFRDRTLNIDAAIAHRFARLQVPDAMPVNDAWIAATALSHGMTLVTRNVKDFRRCGVAWLNPWTRAQSA